MFSHVGLVYRQNRWQQCNQNTNLQFR